MTHSFIAYIDEAGHEAGFNSPGCSEWFILSAVVLRAECDEEVCSAITEFNGALGKDPEWVTSFKDLQDKRCVLRSRIIATKPVRCISVIAHKPSNPMSKEALAQPIKLYRYLGKFLVERISWVCRDYKHLSNVGDGSTLLVFSERRWFPYHEFSEYLTWLKLSGNGTHMAWEHIDPSLIEPRKHDDSRGCQVADTVAGATRIAIERFDLKPVDHPLKGITDDRNIRELRDVFYRNKKGHIRSAGLKLWPPEASKIAESDPRFEWYRLYFPE